MQAHAVGLADAHVGSNWWSHLRALNREEAQQALLQEDQDRWQVRARHDWVTQCRAVEHVHPSTHVRTHARPCLH